MTIQNVVACDQNPGWVSPPWPDDPSAEKQLEMWRTLARECPHRWGGLTFRITVREVAES